MNKLRKALRKNILLQRLSSIKITVACLLLLFILTFWGTVAQVDQGLYQAQERFFNSWYFLSMGFIPFPGAQLVLWVLFINLACVSLTRFVYKLNNIGILIIHLGLLSYFVSAFLTLHMVEESNVTLMEDEGTNVSSAYHQWEVSVWKSGKGNVRKVVAQDMKGVQKEQVLGFDPFGFDIVVRDYYKNAQAYTGKPPSAEMMLKNDSGITSLASVPLSIEPEKNIPGLILDVRGDNGLVGSLILYGGESQPTHLEINGEHYNFLLRRKKYPLPFTILLKEFTKEVHPGTDIASSYQSLVEVRHQGVSRDVVIYMNHPLRHKQYTLYQASYALDASGREYSTLAVVKNFGWWMPYVSSGITFLGLSVHFIMMGFSRKYK